MTNIYCITKFTILIHNKFSRFFIIIIIIFFYVLEFDHSFNYEIDFVWNGRRLWSNRFKREIKYLQKKIEIGKN